MRFIADANWATSRRSCENVTFRICEPSAEKELRTKSERCRLQKFYCVMNQTYKLTIIAVHTLPPPLPVRPPPPLLCATYPSCTPCICDRHLDTLHLKCTTHCITTPDGDGNASRVMCRVQGSHISGLTKFHDLSRHSQQISRYFLNYFNMTTKFDWI